MDWNRESVAAAVVGAGGAWMLGSAILSPRASYLKREQRKGLILSGAGFLLTACAARWMQSYGRVGIAVSLFGSAVAMSGLYLLLRQRATMRDERQRTSRNHDARD